MNHHKSLNCSCSVSFILTPEAIVHIGDSALSLEIFVSEAISTVGTERGFEEQNFMTSDDCARLSAHPLSIFTTEKKPPKAPARNSHSSFTITIYYLLCMRASRMSMTFETVRTVYTHCTSKLNRAGLARLAGSNAVQFGKFWACSHYIL